MGRAKYFEQFSVVELQDPFYEPPSPKLAARWREAAPHDFRFNLKAWQLITHTPASPTYRRLKSRLSSSEHDAYGSFLPTEQVWLAWERTRSIAQILRAKVVLFQCPKSFVPSRENVRNLRAFFEQAGSQEWLTAWEPRGDWPLELVRELCAGLRLIHCVDPFQYPAVHGGPLYWRLHGCGTYRYKYSDAELAQLYGMLHDFGNKTSDPDYVLFNNVYMREDALRFKAVLESGRSAHVLPTGAERGNLEKGADRAHHELPPRQEALSKR